MGFDKTLITIRGGPLLEHLIRIAAQVAGELLVSACDSAPRYFFSLPVVKDRYTGQGPLAGLHAAMMQSEKSLFLLIACDMPNLNDGLLRAIVESSSGCDALVPRTSDGRIHPLCGVYRRTCLDALEAQLAAGMNRVSHFLASPALRVRLFDAAESGFADSDFLNLNDRDDLTRFELAMGHSGRTQGK